MKLNQLLNNKDLLCSFTDNVTHLYSNIYIVRTPSGIKKAIKHYLGYSSSIDGTYKDFLKMNGIDFQNIAKIKLPSLISLSTEYNGSRDITKINSIIF